MIRGTAWAQWARLSRVQPRIVSKSGLHLKTRLGWLELSERSKAAPPEPIKQRSNHFNEVFLRAREAQGFDQVRTSLAVQLLNKHLRQQQNRLAKGTSGGVILSCGLAYRLGSLFVQVGSEHSGCRYLLQVTRPPDGG